MPTASSTFIYIGNFADLDPDETNTSNENPSAIFQTFNYDDMSSTTVVQDDANGDGIVQENDNGQTADTFSYDVGGGPVTSGLDNAARYAVDYVDDNGVTQSTTISAYQTENGDVFLKFPNGLKVNSVTIKSIVGDGYSGITHGTSSSARPVCFAPGTLIATPSGACCVETLQVGGLVETLDHGPQAIRWVHSGEHALEAAGPEGKPVLIRAGALGQGRPSRDLIVSPHHRIIVGGRGQLEDQFQTEAFAPAKSLTALPRVRHMMGKKEIRWVHFACDNHEIVYANGCLTEALLLGPMVLQTLTGSRRRALIEMYGVGDKVDDALNGPVARRCLTAGEVRRHLKKGRAARAQIDAAQTKTWKDALNYRLPPKRSTSGSPQRNHHR